MIEMQWVWHDIGTQVEMHSDCTLLDLDGWTHTTLLTLIDELPEDVRGVWAMKVKYPALPEQVWEVYKSPEQAYAWTQGHSSHTTWCSVMSSVRHRVHEHQGSKWFGQGKVPLDIRVNKKFETVRVWASHQHFDPEVYRTT